MVNHIDPAKRTLATVASAAGVSTMTVSNTYNRPDKVSSALRSRVLAAAAELGYPGPNPAARSLRRGRIGALGVVMGESLGYAFEDPAAIQFLQGLAAACGPQVTGLYLIPATGADSDQRLVRDAAVDAFILFGLSDDHALVKAALARGLPLLSCGGPELAGHLFVGIDDRAAAHAAATHLLDLNHRQLAVLSLRLGVTPAANCIRAAGPADQKETTFRVARERLSGYRDAYTAAGGDWADVAVYETASNSHGAGYATTLALLRDAPHVTAVLAMSDQLARGAAVAARKLGRAVPDELSIIGWDDTLDPANVQTLALTTIRQSLHDQGYLIGQLALASAPTLLEEARNQPWELVQRASTTACEPNPD